MMQNKIMLFLLLILVTGCSENPPTGKVIEKTTPSEIGKEISVYLCPRDNCEGALIEVINSSTKYAHCAFFDIDLKNLIKLIGNKSHSIDVRLVVDNENYGEIKGP